MSSARVSIVIPTKNGEKTLPAVLHAIWQQRFTGGIEVVAVDSGSTDGNPKTGEEIPITARRVVTFHASQKLKALVDKHYPADGQQQSQS
jgi:glycosyltransferase involved in cell wall biosynthesis